MQGAQDFTNNDHSNFKKEIMSLSPFSLMLRYYIAMWPIGLLIIPVSLFLLHLSKIVNATNLEMLNFLLPRNAAFDQ